jgi:hypothetical protein
VGKDKRHQTWRREPCARCDNFAEEDSELCASCEEDVLDALNTIEVQALYDDPLDQERADSMVGE